MFQGRPLMVRIKAKTMACASYAPRNGYAPLQPYSAYQLPYSSHIPPQTLYSSDVWASGTAYQGRAEVRALWSRLRGPLTCAGSVCVQQGAVFAHRMIVFND